MLSSPLVVLAVRSHWVPTNPPYLAGYFYDIFIGIEFGNLEISVRVEDLVLRRLQPESKDHDHESSQAGLMMLLCRKWRDDGSDLRNEAHAPVPATHARTTDQSLSQRQSLKSVTHLITVACKYVSIGSRSHRIGDQVKAEKDES